MLPIYNTTICPACFGSKIKHQFDCLDHSISKENFQIWECDTCLIRFTRPVLPEEQVGRYYQADHYISHSDTSDGLISQLYKMVRNITLSEKRRVVQRATSKAVGKLLDIGSGTGAYAYEMKMAGWDVTGIEPDEGARLNAAKLYNLAFHEPSELYKLEHGQFDAITLWHVLEHVYDIHGYLQQIKKLLKPQGTLIIAVPNYTSNDAQHYGSYWAAYDVPRHLYHFAPLSVHLLAEKYGYMIWQQRAMWFDSFYISLLSEQYKYKRNRYLPALWQGIISSFHTLLNRAKCSSVMYVLKK